MWTIATWCSTKYNSGMYIGINFWYKQGYQIFFSSTSLLTNTMTELQKNRAKISIAKIALRWPILEFSKPTELKMITISFATQDSCSFNHWLFSNLLQIKVSRNEIYLWLGLVRGNKWPKQPQRSLLIVSLSTFNCRKCYPSHLKLTFGQNWTFHSRKFKVSGVTFYTFKAHISLLAYSKNG